ncbi:hypothetical protein FQN55_008877 [Onygenales sp. PD_40]|nr:hypothetical protein FQN55_008877 [Onygenales sp. PD_40]
MSASSPVLRLEGLSVFITGATDDIGIQAVRGFLGHGCRVTAHDLHMVEPSLFGPPNNRLHIISGNVADEDAIRSCIDSAQQKFGPISILIVNARIGEEYNDSPIWETPLEHWERSYRINVRGSFLAIKHFLRAAREAKHARGAELPNLAIVVIGTEHGEVGEAENMRPSGPGALNCRLIQQVKKDIVLLDRNARINAIDIGQLDKPSSERQLGGLMRPCAQTQAISPVETIARAGSSIGNVITYLASHHAASHLSGICLQASRSEEGRVIWREDMIIVATGIGTKDHALIGTEQSCNISVPVLTTKKPKIRIALSIDLDAVSGWLGTGTHPDNVLADYSAGFFAAKVGVPRLLKLLKKLKVADKCTWFIPGHSAESFKEEVSQVVQSGCEIGLHGYAHEGAYQLTLEQERDVLEKCIAISTALTGKRPVGYRAPLYQIRESTLGLLEEYGFEYDASLTDHDCYPFFAPRRPPLKAIDFSQPASSWMHPIPEKIGPHGDRRPLVEVPCNWYMEDMTPMQFLPHTPNSQGYVDVRVVEQLWKDRFLWLWQNEEEPIFPLLMHPDTSGMAHVIGMIERMITWLKSWGPEVEFCQTREIARHFREKNLD